MQSPKLIQLALMLTTITLTYNLAKGLVSVIFGISDDALALLGFGVDNIESLRDKLVCLYPGA